mmetsp:Transcript_24319/g.76605  ORF Transcript_24319/g.76605 Transcript_24319/m.76605 type:complete len:199 (+) Transcript_24319:1049-1645(+)
MEQMAQQMVDNNLLAMASAIEAQLDDQMHKLDNMGEEDLDRIREKRIAAMKKQRDKKLEWLQKGHGEVTQIDDEKQFFKEMKGEDRMVCHFYKKNQWPSKVMDKHVADLAKRHLETKFCRVRAPAPARGGVRAAHRAPPSCPPGLLAPCPGLAARRGCDTGEGVGGSVQGAGRYSQASLLGRLLDACSCCLPPSARAA